MKKGCSSIVFRQFELDRALEAICRVGYSFFETQATNPWCNHVVVDRDDPIMFSEKAKKYGLGVTALWTKEGALIPTGDSCVETISRHIAWAGAAGIPVLNFGDGHKPAEMSDEEAFKRLSDRILTLLEIAEKNNVILALEPHGTFSLTADGLKRILSISNSPYLGINYDCANIQRAGYVETKEGVATWRSTGQGGREVEILKDIVNRVVHFHAKDLSEEGKCVALGTGIVDVAGCIDVLKKSGYQGAVSLETEGGIPFEDAEELARVSSLYINRCLG